MMPLHVMKTANPLKTPRLLKSVTNTTVCSNAALGENFQIIYYIIKYIYNTR